MRNIDTVHACQHIYIYIYTYYYIIIHHLLFRHTFKQWQWKGIVHELKDCHALSFFLIRRQRELIAWVIIWTLPRCGGIDFTWVEMTHINFWEMALDVWRWTWGPSQKSLFLQRHHQHVCWSGRALPIPARQLMKIPTIQILLPSIP